MSTNRNIGILFFTLSVMMLGFGLIIPILPFYVESLGASGSALGMLMATYGSMQFIFAPVWGQVSDRVGRHLVIATSLLMFPILMAMALAIQGPLQWPDRLQA